MKKSSFGALGIAAGLSMSGCDARNNDHVGEIELENGDMIVYIDSAEQPAPTCGYQPLRDSLGNPIDLGVVIESSQEGVWACIDPYPENRHDD